MMNLILIMSVRGTDRPFVQKFDNAIGISEFKILGEQCKIMDNTNMRSSGWIEWIGGEGHWKQEDEVFLVLGSLGVKGELEEKTDKGEFLTCLPGPGICYLSKLQWRVQIKYNQPLNIY